MSLAASPATFIHLAVCGSSREFTDTISFTILHISLVYTTIMPFVSTFTNDDPQSEITWVKEEECDRLW